MADMSQDKEVCQRKYELIEEVNFLLDTIKRLYAESKDPYSDPVVLTDIIKRGIIDAPHLRGNESAKGTLETRLTGGKCMAYSRRLGREVTERERLQELFGDKSTELFPI
jgi:hypothetical protein